MSEILQEYVQKRVKVVYKDGANEDGSTKIKTFVATLIGIDETMAQFEMDEGVKTAIARSDLVRITEKK